MHCTGDDCIAETTPSTGCYWPFLTHLAKIALSSAASVAELSELSELQAELELSPDEPDDEPEDESAAVQGSDMNISSKAHIPAQEITKGNFVIVISSSPAQTPPPLPPTPTKIFLSLLYPPLTGAGGALATALQIRRRRRHRSSGQEVQVRRKRHPQKSAQSATPRRLPIHPHAPPARPPDLPPTPLTTRLSADPLIHPAQGGERGRGGGRLFCRVSGSGRRGSTPDTSLQCSV